ncbi:hypothetical protein AB0E96_41110, partial [Kitasatospora sp. NPDC036755]|uniref:hypothetical protein n=1 Tax=Kitasatospora sp. NPDC036755 TaxID=3154600 RepID=UPI003409C9D1
ESEAAPATVITPALRKWRRRRYMQKITDSDRSRVCGRNALVAELGVLTARTEDDGSTVRGQRLCGSVWLCAFCDAKKRAENTHLLTTAGLRWLAKGGTFVGAVMTVRHRRKHTLQALANALLGGREIIDKATGEVVQAKTAGGYEKMFRTRNFREVIGPSVGYVGAAKNPEVTRSQDGGWHLHLNAGFFLGGNLVGTPARGSVTDTYVPDEDAITAFQNWFRNAWTAEIKKIEPEFEPSTSCERPGCKCRGKGHGVTFMKFLSGDEEALFKYLTKDGSERTDTVSADLDTMQSTAAELAYSAAKDGRRKSMTPFQFLDRLWAIEEDGIDPDLAPGYGTPADLRKWWAEYEAEMPGRRAFKMTLGLRRHAEVTGEEEKYRELEQEKRLVAGAILTADAHRFVSVVGGDYRVQEEVAAGRETAVPELVAEIGGRPEHVRVVDESGCEEYKASLVSMLKAKAKTTAAGPRPRRPGDRHQGRPGPRPRRRV